MRGRGLWVGIELDRPNKPYCEALLQEGVLTRIKRVFTQLQ
ncbi:hypothetical protein [Pseudomonas sp. HLS-6 TE3448]